MNAAEPTTVDDCYTRFADEWICMEVVEEKPGYVVSGRVVAHSREKADVLRAERVFRNTHVDAVTYVFFAGPVVDPSEDVVVIL